MTDTNRSLIERWFGEHRAALQTTPVEPLRQAAIAGIEAPLARRWRPAAAIAAVLAVTVAEGRVAVGSSSSDGHSHQFVELGEDQPLKLTAGEWPPQVLAVDAESSTAWLHRQLAFDHEPLERVVAEFDRYAAKPIMIITPALRTLQITGVFATDDPEEIIAFLRSLKGVRVEITATQIRVSGN
jgi:ferric-dicitrate binding protein FerR (iron transport regulator)